MFDKCQGHLRAFRSGALDDTTWGLLLSQPAKQRARQEHHMVVSRYWY